MLVTFAGSSHVKYTGYLLDTISFLEFDAGQELRTMFLQNWLVNPSGEAGRYLEKYLMQEHHNAVLEERSKRQGMSWDSRQMRDVHSRTVQHIKRIKKELRSTLELSPKGWKHTKPHDRAEIRRLLDLYHTTELHTFRRGRQYRSSAGFVNEFSQGVEKLEAKLDKWKTDLEHSDLIATTLSETPQASTPYGEVGGDDEVDDNDKADNDDKVDDNDKADDNDDTRGDVDSGGEDLAVGVAQTEGHREFVGGELYMVNDEDESEATNV